MMKKITNQIEKMMKIEFLKYFFNYSQAQPIHHYKPLQISKSTKRLTLPINPKFHVDERN
jgi:hypothetical protein